MDWHPKGPVLAQCCKWWQGICCRRWTPLRPRIISLHRLFSLLLSFNIYILLLPMALFDSKLVVSVQPKASPPAR